MGQRSQKLSPGQRERHTETGVCKTFTYLLLRAVTSKNGLSYLYNKEHYCEGYEEYKEDGRAVGDENDGGNDERHVEQPEIHVHRYVHVYVVHVFTEPVQDPTLQHSMVKAL